MTESSRLLKQYQHLVEVSQEIASSLDLKPLLKKLMSIAVEMVEASEASILLYDQNAHQLYFETATNFDTAPLLKKVYVPEDSIAGWVALNRRPQIINKVAEDERHFSDLDQKMQFSTRSMIAVPLVAKQKLIGVLEVLNKKRGAFDEEDQEILLALGAQAAIAVENSRLFQQSDLIAEFVHELRTPLSSILTAAYLLQRPEIPEEQRLKMSQTIHGEAQRLNELASLFLDLARLQSGRVNLKITTFDPRQLMQECLQLISMKSSEREIELFLDAPDQLPEIQGDRDKVKQVILNLLSNAVKYNRPKGKVWLRAGMDSQVLCITVQDTGLGIPPDQVSQLFTRFFRARNVEQTTPGTGLGLSISQQIVERHNGTIEANSQLGIGTSFIVKLPLVQPKPM